jgi:hypothetical protein
MKRIITLSTALIICFTLPSKAQDKILPDFYGLYKESQFTIGLSGMYIEYPKFATRTGYGLTLSTSVSKNVALTWHLYFGQRYFSTSMWLPLGPLLFSASVLNGNINKSALGLLLISILPDGVSFPIRLNDKLYITPSIAPFWMDMYGRDVAYKRFYIGGNIGLGFHIKLKYFNIHPYVAGHLLYTAAPNTGYSGGIGIELPLGKLEK